MTEPPPPPADLLEYYGADLEDGRLLQGIGALEFTRTKVLIRRFLAAASKVADVGGGTGHYAEWLAEEGHDVDLIDPVPLHVARARERSGDPPRFGVDVGDARQLPFADASLDAVLLLGPLYHLGDEHDRAQALSQAARVCRPGGLVFAAAISRFAPLLDTIRRGHLTEARVFVNVQSETVTGRRVPAAGRTSPFPDAYFHLPDELEQELTAAGLVVHEVYAVEGPGWLLPDLDATWEDEEVRARVLWAAEATERDRHVIALSPHLLAVARKP